jgi:hypothetical protein
MRENSITILLKSKKTVFDFNDLTLLWQIKDQKYLKTKVYRLVKNRQILRLRKGIFVLDKDYNRYELANKLVNPSYVSLQTILANEGIIFQYDGTIYSVSRINKEIKIGKQRFVYRKIKDEALLNSEGIKIKTNFSIASEERALVDLFYLEKDCYFDNLEKINWEFVFDLALIYNNKSLVKRLKAIGAGF